MKYNYRIISASIYIQTIIKVKESTEQIWHWYIKVVEDKEFSNIQTVEEKDKTNDSRQNKKYPIQHFLCSKIIQITKYCKTYICYGTLLAVNKEMEWGFCISYAVELFKFR